MLRIKIFLSAEVLGKCLSISFKNSLAMLVCTFLQNGGFNQMTFPERSSFWELVGLVL
jgi:hypothetical protein